jgi:hypothetical protein
MLKQMFLKGIGPSPELRVELGERLNLFTGDNGLGKTFLLDVAWWALTGTWASAPAWPQGDHPQVEPLISCQFSDGDGPSPQPLESRYDFSRQLWSRRWPIERADSLVIYVRVDGGFSVWDPVRNYAGDEGGVSYPRTYPYSYADAQAPVAYHFSSAQVWEGLEQGSNVVCNGLIRDWVSWQNRPKPGKDSPFRSLTRVMERLSPHPQERLRPGEPMRVSIQDVREVPTLEMPYGRVPVIYAAAGMKRILALAYLLVWTWHEHVQAAGLARQKPAQSLIMLIDEPEAHLHPQWQRTILPALLGAADDLAPHICTQILATTHAPLILASVEPMFDEGRDRLSAFELKGRKVRLVEIPWAKQGDAVSWLVSPAFGLAQARSREAEQAIEAAEAYMRHGPLDGYPKNLRTKEGIHAELLRVLAGHDSFWPRWIVAAEEGSR